MTPLPERFRLGVAERRRVMAVAEGSAPADLVLRGGSVLNVFTEQVQTADVGVAAGRIAWLGRDPGGGSQSEADVSGHILLPGFIEPHAHLDVMYRPEQALEMLGRHGTTCVCGDPVFFMTGLDDASFLALARELGSGPVRLLWNFRPWVDSLSKRELERLGEERVADLFERLPDVVATGELSSWPALFSGDDGMARLLERAIDRGLRLDGHAPGASRKRLGQLLVTGMTACHEAITGDELLTRLSLGYWTMLRHSDLRPDGPILARALASSGLPTERVLLTTDGPEAESLAQGHLDRVIEIVVDVGVDPVRAIKMATLNVTTYLGLDAHIGSIAPGRCADLLAVRRLERPSPERVWIGGREFAPGEHSIDWSRFPFDPIAPAPVCERDFETFLPLTPGLLLEGVVTRALPNPGGPLPPDWIRAYLISRAGDAITGVPLHGAGSVDGFATSATGYGNVLVVGRSPAAMLDAYQRVVAMGGGLACACGPELPLPVGGTMTALPFADFLSARSTIQQEVSRRGLSVASLDYFGLFMSVAVIPQVKLTDRGVVHVKRRQILVPARPLA